ncbi:MAG: HypC/HybG/HupF family hydrogenase formation chaperone [Bdellovibrionota bacterium]
MCLAIPARVSHIDGDGGTVELDGVTKDVSFILVPKVKVGDHVLVHVGFALSVLSDEELEQTLREVERYNEHQ